MQDTLKPKILGGMIRDLRHDSIRDEEVGDFSVHYELESDEGVLPLTSALGQEIQIRFTGTRSCINCGRKVNKLYQNGYCFPCVTTLAECDLCIVKPHECHYHLGTCREPSFGDTHCMIPHYVYLADSSAVKVGLTRKGRELRRWVDQGATSALLLAEVPTRKIAGELEMEIAKHLPDKTDWRKMLKDTGDSDADLRAVREEVIARMDESYKKYVLPSQAIQLHRFQYPRMEETEVLLKSISLDKQPILTAHLKGIKGQYLLLSEGVLNIRKHRGYHIEMELN